MNLTPYIVKIQKWYRGSIVRLKRLPLILYSIQAHLKQQAIQFSTHTDDGRINSCMDEDHIINILIKTYGERIKRPEKRHWYDILAYDTMYGWLPINIKTTTTVTSDNTGNLAMCVYAYTDEHLDLYKPYDNGKMSIILYDKLKSKNYNLCSKKDYYFVVLNKTNANDVIVNSVKGLSQLTPNINNLPFQVKWCNNNVFKYEHITKKITQFIHCLQKPNPSWSETFMINMRRL